MLIDAIVVKLVRNGGRNNPSYSVTIECSGKLIYEGFENVEKKGTVKEDFDAEKVISLLSSLKDSGFFSINQNFSVNEQSDRTFTTITVNIPGENNVTKTKSITHYNDDPAVPASLINFENRIDAIVETGKWIRLAEPLKVEQKIKEESIKDISKKPKDKAGKSKKPIAIIAGIIIVIAIVAMLIFSGAIPIFNGSNGSSFYDPPTISEYATASNIFGNYIEESKAFGLGNTVYVYYSIDNIVHYGNYSIIINTTAYLNGVIIDSFEFEKNGASNESAVNDSISFQVGDAWNTGDYIINVTINDQISGESSSFFTDFTIFEEVPEILTLLTADNVTGYRDYEINSIFERYDNISIYAEYTGIVTTNDNTLTNINLSIVVSLNEIDYVSIREDKIKVGNNAHRWWIITNSSWLTGFYTVKLTLLDYSTGLTVQDQTFFYLS